MLVDLDPQAALTARPDISVAHLTASVYQTLLDDKLDPTTLVKTTTSGVDAAGDAHLAAAEFELVNMTLPRACAQRRAREASPTLRSHLDRLPAVAWSAHGQRARRSRPVIIPLQCEFLATRGLTLLLKTLTRIQERLNRDLRIEGILPTMFDGRTTHATEVLQELRENFPGQVFDVVIKFTVRLKELPAAGLSILDYDRGHDVADAYVRLAEVVDHG